MNKFFDEIKLIFVRNVFTKNATQVSKQYIFNQK